MARVFKKDGSKGKTTIIYPLWPTDGEAEGTITEWESGDGYDIDLNGTIIELTHFELAAVQALIHLYHLEDFMERKSYSSEPEGKPNE